MIKRFLTLLMLALCVSVFFYDTAVPVLAGTKPLIVMSWISGDSIHVEVSGGESGTGTVYINAARINYGANGAFDVPARSYAGTGEFISVYAIDSAAEKSNTIVIENPYYAPPATPPLPSPDLPTPTPVQTPAVVQQAAQTQTPAASESGVPAGDKPFSVEGTGTVVDNAYENDGKEFFTVTSEDGNEFFLIVDRQRAGNNVYLLNAVTENDLAALAKKSGASISAVPESTTTPQPTPVPTPAPATEQEAKPPASSGYNTGAILIILVAVAGVGGAGYYIKIVKPKSRATNEDEYDDSADDSQPDRYDDDDEYDDDENDE